MEIFKVHVRDVPLDDDVDLSRMAAATVGLTGADIRNIVNEAALWAARQDKNRVDMADFEYARDKVLMGSKREEVLSDKEKEKTAYHEAGHTLSAWKSPGAHRVHKVTIIPRGRTLGVTHTVPVGRPLEHGRARTARSSGRGAGRTSRGEAGLSGDHGRRGKRSGAGDRPGPPHGHALGHERTAGAGQLQDLRGGSVSSDARFHRQRMFSEHTMELIDEEVARILHDAAKQRGDNY